MKRQPGTVVDAVTDLLGSQERPRSRSATPIVIRRKRITAEPMTIDESVRDGVIVDFLPPVGLRRNHIRPSSPSTTVTHIELRLPERHWRMWLRSTWVNEEKRTIRGCAAHMALFFLMRKTRYWAQIHVKWRAFWKSRELIILRPESSPYQ